jgi:hypothetical protein
MTIDERLDKIAIALDKLKERHEALTQTVELMAVEGQRLLEVTLSHERRIERLEGQ